SDSRRRVQLPGSDKRVNRVQKIVGIGHRLTKRRLFGFHRLRMMARERAKKGTESPADHGHRSERRAAECLANTWPAADSTPAPWLIVGKKAGSRGPENCGTARLVFPEQRVSDRLRAPRRSSRRNPERRDRSQSPYLQRNRHPVNPFLFVFFLDSVEIPRRTD